VKIDTTLPAPARLLHEQAGKIAQQIDHTAGIARLDRVLVDDRDIAAGLFTRKPCGGDNDIFRRRVCEAWQTYEDRSRKTGSGCAKKRAIVRQAGLERAGN
jgi:hypothetical protein